MDYRAKEVLAQAEETIRAVILNVGEVAFFSALCRVVKAREIDEYLAADKNHDDPAYKHAKEATTLAECLEWRIKKANEEANKRDAEVCDICGFNVELIGHSAECPRRVAG